MNASTCTLPIAARTAPAATPDLLARGGADHARQPAAAGRELEGYALLRHAMLTAFPGRIAVVSSFGAESAVLLAWAAEIDPMVPVLFMDTGQHFAETLEYRRALVAALGLRNVQDIRPEAAALASSDPVGLLHGIDPDGCCALRKTDPLDSALAPYKAWVTGRKRYQAAGRRDLPLLELVDGRVKLNPLADWSASDLAAEILARGLPRHPLSLRGYPSIGCAPCTQQVAPGEDPRSGRWRGLGKTECGIHRPA